MYTFNEFQSDVQKFFIDSKDFFQAQINYGIEQIQQADNATAEFRQAV